MANYLKSFFTIKNLFNVRPEPISASGFYILISIFGVFLVLAVLAKFWQKKNKNDRLFYLAYEKFFYLFLTMGIIELFYAGFAYEGVMYLSAKFLLMVWLAVVLIWLYFAGKNLFIIVPNKKKNIKSKKEFEKYLP